MLVLIDESGCPGFKMARGSSNHFVVAMVIFNTYKDAEEASLTIEAAKKDLRVKPEFKFSKCADAVRDGFFRRVAHHAFRVRAIVVEKDKIYSSHLRSKPRDFYSYVIQMLMKHDGGALANASVKIDKCGDRNFNRALNTYLRTQLGGGKIKKFKSVNSQADNLIQLADMTAGAIHRCYTGKPNPDRWREMIDARIEDEWKFG